METLSKRQMKLLQCFHGDEIWTAAQLSEMLRISQRTIRSEIKSIHVQYDGLLLSIKSKGYQLNMAHELTLSIHDSIQDKPVKTRYINILKEILSHKETDYYELAQQLFISESTLDKQIASMNQIIERRNPDIRIERKNNKLIINGDEEKHRQIYTYLLNHEIDQYNFDLHNYTEFFNSCDISELKIYILQFNRSEGLEMRDFEIISFILHIAILLERVNKGNEITNIEGYHPSAEADALAHRFAIGLQERFDVELSNMELQYLSCLFAGKISDMDSDKLQEYRDFLNTIIKNIHEQYEIDLREDEEFMENLLIHLLGLDSRIRSQSFLNNPLIKDIKLHFPLLYDISVYVAMKIQTHFQTTLIEDEIGYITLHIMSAVERLQQHNHKRVVIVNPLGSATSSYLKQKLVSTKELSIEVSGVFSLFDMSEVSILRPDLLISLVPLPQDYGIPVYTCVGFPTDQDIERICTILKQHQDHVEYDLSSYFHEDLYFLNQDFATKEAVIHFLCEQLQAKGYCEVGYEEKVLAREQIAPTAYGNQFCIPHPIEKCAKQNAIAVCILKQPILWNNRKTRLIFLFSLLPRKDPAFDELFERLVNLLNDASKVKTMIKASNLSIFLNVFLK